MAARPENWLLTDPSQTPLAQLALRLRGPVDAEGSSRLSAALSSRQAPAAEVWELAKRGEAQLTDRWRLWRDEAFWSGAAPHPAGLRLRGFEALAQLRPELMWFFNQPGAGLAPTLRTLLSSSDWSRPLLDPGVLGSMAAVEGVPPRELLRGWGAGPSAPEHMAAALERYTAELCDRVGARGGPSALSESAVDELLFAAVQGESAAAPRWSAEPAQLTPAERGAVTAVMRAVPPAMWGMLRKTRALLLEWGLTQEELIGPAGVAALKPLRGFTASDQLLRAAEAIAGSGYGFVQEVWDRQRHKEKVSTSDRDTANILKRVGFFMNYASELRGCALLLDRDARIVDGAKFPPVIHPFGSVAGDTGDRIVLLFQDQELLVKLSGKDLPGDPLIRRFRLSSPARVNAVPVIDLQVWAMRAERIAHSSMAKGELPNEGWTMAGQAWQPDLMRALAREGLLPDPGLSLVRGTPSWHQDSSMALIDELRRGR